MIHVFQFVYILNMWDHPQPSWCTDTQCSCSATLYCSPVLSKQMTGEMMNVVVISPQRCSPGRRGNQWEAPEDRPALYIPATSHTHTHTPTTTAWESQRHLIHHSVCLRKDSERGWGTFFPPPDLHEWTSRGRVFSHVFCPVSLKWSGTEYQDGKNDLYKAEISQQMTCDCPY